MISMYFTYIVQSLKDNKYYIGSTQDLLERLHEHNVGTTKSLVKRLPVKLVYYESFETKKLVQARERKIKSYKGGQAFKKLLIGAVPEWPNG